MPTKAKKSETAEEIEVATEIEASKSVLSYEDLTDDDIAVIERYAMYAGCGGLVPFPVLDFGILFVVQVKMIMELAQLHGVRADKARVKTMLAAILGGGAPQVARAGTIAGLASATKAIPLVGTAVGVVVGSSVAYAETQLIGRVFANHFRDGRAIAEIDVNETRAWLSEKSSALAGQFKRTPKANDVAPEPGA